MDKSDLILDKLNAMEKALRADNKALSDKVDKLTEKQDMFWQAVMETRKDITDIKNETNDNNITSLK